MAAVPPARLEPVVEQSDVEQSDAASHRKPYQLLLIAALALLAIYLTRRGWDSAAPRERV
jgi:hypothetical protein